MMKQMNILHHHQHHVSHKNVSHCGFQKIIEIRKNGISQIWNIHHAQPNVTLIHVGIQCK